MKPPFYCLILTDLEGVAGTNRFTQTRTEDCGPDGKGPSMRQLAQEVNACIAGIRDHASDAVIDVLDGHGSGGLFPEAIVGARLLPRETPFRAVSGYGALFFVGQHAMAGTIAAPLCHTFSSTNVDYFKLNGVFIGEFGVRALQAGLLEQSPTVFLSGDDKAVAEARMFVPEIETVTTKYGTGLESARHREPGQVCAEIRAKAARAAARRAEIPPFTLLQPPFRFEAQHRKPLPREFLEGLPKARSHDAFRYVIETDDLRDLPF